jgi:uncharacterized SAM-binding protein YcdF (DUF218 family)
MLVGMMLLFAVRGCVNGTSFADRLVQPMLVADTRGPADAIVVPGAGITAFCTPNPTGVQRTLLAARLYHQNREALMVFSAGRPSGSPCTVAEAMADLAERLGVPRDRIRVEINSTTTWENALRSDAVLRAAGVSRIRLVTDALHMRRTEASYSRFGYKIERSSVPVPLAYIDNVRLLRYAAYETLAMLYYQARGYAASVEAIRAHTVPVSNTSRKMPTTLTLKVLL